MFKGHQSAEEFGMSPARLSYVVTFGLAPYFKSTFMNNLIPLKGSLRLPPKCVSCFDESLNKVVHSKQTDVHIIYLDEINKQVKRVYIGSQFMGHAAVDDMIKDFREAHNGLDYVMNFIQFLMDGPNTNWAFHQAASDLRKSENPCAPDLLEIGSCGLHLSTVHLALVWGRPIGRWERSSISMVHFQEVFCPKIILSICE